MSFSPEFIKDVEIKYLRILADLIQNGDLEYEAARATAEYFLTLLPFEHLDDMKAKIQQLVEKYPQLIELHVYLLKHIEESQTSDVLDKMRNLMKENQIDAALQMAQHV